MKKMFLLFLTSCAIINAQPIYELPFNSKGNEIELTVANTSEYLVESASIEITAFPAWIHFENLQATVCDLIGGCEIPTAFKFSVDKNAPLGKEEKIVFKIETLHGDTWNRELIVSVSKPLNYELTQNYPNPFNPSTKIEYVIPNDDHVTIKIYDILGREVKTLFSEFMKAGHHEIEFNAKDFASGTYIYSLSSGNFHQNKKMMLIK